VYTCIDLSKSKPLASGLRSLAAQLHHAKHKSITRDAEQRRDADVSPPVIPLVDVHGPEIIRARGVGAVLARSAVFRVGDVTGVGTEEVCHVFSACCARGQGNLCELIWPALDLHIVDDGLEEAADEVGEWVEVVHLQNIMLAGCPR
jgi:hypothetical protein